MMARSKSINVILNLKDKFTQPIQRTAKQTKQFEREVKRVENNINKSTSKIKKDFANMSKSVMKSVSSISLKGLKIGGIAGAGIIGAGLTSGILEGLDYEGYKVQLETATRDTKKASELMSEAIQYANKTPFETGQVIEATAKFESMGLSAKKWLSITSDMAGATSKDLIQAVEAVIDAVASGEFERLKEFGIKKDALDGFDKSGKLVDQTAMINSLMEEMQSRYKGGAEALSKTTKGMWSTVTGVFKNSMAKVVGIMDDGTVRSGSLLDKLRNVISRVADTMVKWQSDGTIQKISATLDKLINGAINGFKTVMSVITDVIGKMKSFYSELKSSGALERFIKLLINVGAVIGTVVLVQKAWTTATKIHAIFLKRQAIIQGTVNAATKIWNALAISNPWGLVITGIIALLVLLVLNFEEVVAWCKNFATAFMTAFNQAKEYVMQLYSKFAETFPLLSNIVTDVINGVKQSFQGVIDFFTGVFTGNWELALNGLKTLTEGVFSVIKGIFLAPFRAFATGINWVIDKVNSLSFTLPEWVPVVGGKTFGFDVPKIPNFATGTSYHRGGLARINEGGRGEIVNLPNGSQVIPSDKSKNALKNNTTITVPITIQGNVYGDRDLLDRIGGMITQRVCIAIGNV